MSTPLRLLILEDNPSDLALVLDHLRTSGFTVDFRHATTQAEFLNQLDVTLDLILADYCLPQYDGIKALQDLQKHAFDIPFILISGNIGEDLAVEAMKQGACDYLLKDRLARLGQAVRRALDQRECRRARLHAERTARENQRLLRALLDNIPDPAWLKDAEGRFLAVNKALTRFFDRAEPEMLGLTVADLFPRQRDEFLKAEQTVKDRQLQSRVEQQLNDSDGQVCCFDTIESPILDNNGRLTGIAGIARDITERKRAEDALRESENRYYRLFNNSNDAILVSPITPEGMPGRFLEVNDAACQRLGYTREELLQLSPFNIDAPESLDLIKRHSVELLSRNQLIFETEHVAKDGRRIPVEINARILSLHGQKTVLSLVRDISDRRQAERALRESERRFREMLENIHLVAVMLDRQGRILFGNQYLLDMTGWTSEEVLGKVWFDTFIPPDADLRPIFEGFMTRESGSSYFETDILTRAGLRRTIAWNHTILCDVQGQAVGIACIGEDITQRKQAEEDLRASEERYRALVHTSPDAIILTDREGRIVFASPRVNEVFGAPSDVSVIGKSPLDWFAAEYHEKVGCAMQALLEGKPTGKTNEYRLLKYDRTPFWGELVSAPLRDARGHVMGILTICRDVTKRKEAERERILLADAISASSNEIFLFNTDTLRFLYANTGALNNLGYRLEELQQKTPLDIKPEHTRESLQQIIEPLLRDEKSMQVFETVHERADGSRYPVEVHLQLIRLEDSRVFLAVIQDITERRQSEADMRRLAEAVNQTAEAIVITNPAAVIEYVNPAFERITGYASTEAIGKTPRILKSGQQTDTFYQDLWHTIAAGRMWSGRMVNKRKDGVHYTEDCTISPVKNGGGKIEHFVAIKRDISRELQLEAQLRQAQKMEAVGQLAGGVAHDFNNILAVILMHLGMLQCQKHLTPETQSSLKELETAAQRAANLTRQLLLFSRRQALQVKPLDLNHLLADLVKMLRRLLGEHIELVFQGSGTPMWMEGDAGMMEQVVMNLAVNARDAMPKGGRLTIATRPVHLDGQNANKNVEFRIGSCVCLTVSDTGCGMDAATLQRIYEPFFTTKEVGHGTGLGLSTVHGIIKQHQGLIEVESVPGEGTTFRVYIPALARGVMTDAAPTTVKACGGDETILLVEDESFVRSVAAHCLRQYGYQVIEAANGQEAVQRWAQNEGRIDLLFTDMVMPEGMTGLELASRLKQANAALKVILSSGYNVEMNMPGWNQTQGFVCLTKPFDIETLAATVRKCLDQE